MEFYKVGDMVKWNGHECLITHILKDAKTDEFIYALKYKVFIDRQLIELMGLAYDDDIDEYLIGRYY